MYEPISIVFVPPGAALNVICGLTVPAALTLIMPSNLTTLNAVAFVEFTSPPPTAAKKFPSCTRDGLVGVEAIGYDMVVQVQFVIVAVVNAKLIEIV